MFFLILETNTKEYMTVKWKENEWWSIIYRLKSAF